MGKDRIQLITLNYRNTPVEDREKLALDDELKRRLRELINDEIKEVVYLFTCNRVEFYLFGGEGSKIKLKEFIGDLKDREVASLIDKGEHLFEKDAVIHAFRVASSLDSMVLGEPQIVGQFKSAFEEARSLNLTGPVLNNLFTKAITVSKKIRSKTAIGEAPLSVSHAACDLAERVFGEFDKCLVLLIGAGEMAELAATYLKDRGVKGLIVINRTFERAVELAEKLGAVAKPFDRLKDALVEADIVISSTSASGFIITKRVMEEVMRLRRNRPMLLIDIAVPRDIEREVEDLENVYLYDVDDLEAVVEENRRRREKEVHKAMLIIEEEVEVFWRWYENQEVYSLIADIRNWAEEIRLKEMQKTLSKLKNLGEEERIRESIDALTKALTNKLLHPLMSYAKEEIARNNPHKVYHILRDIFKGGGNENKNRN
jgi:glutamyl-tRNA reductase